MLPGTGASRAAHQKGKQQDQRRSACTARLGCLHVLQAFGCRCRTPEGEAARGAVRARGDAVGESAIGLVGGDVQVAQTSCVARRHTYSEASYHS